MEGDLIAMLSRRGQVPSDMICIKEGAPRLTQAVLQRDVSADGRNAAGRPASLKCKTPGVPRTELWHWHPRRHT